LALASVQYPGNGTNRLFSVSFPYILRIHVKVFLNYDVVTGIGTELVDGPGFSWLSDTQIQTTAAPALGATVTIIRRTPSGVQLVVYAAGSPPTPTDLNAADLQALYAIQEQADLAAATAALAANSAVAVTSALPYQPVASVANIPAPPTNGQRIEISNSTGIQSFSPLTGRPSAFIGESNLFVRLVYTTTGNTWQWVDYRVTDPDSRYALPVSVKRFGAVGDGVTDDTVAIQAALDSGATEVVIAPGTYSVTGLEIKSGSALRTLRGIGFPLIRLVTGASRIALLISKAQFLQVEHIEFDSSGTKSDGNGTVGIKAVSKSYMTFKRLRFTDFSLRAMQIQQCVYWGLEDITINSCTYGLSFEKSGGVQCTAVTVRGAYISNCSRGIYMDGASTMQFESCIMEYCGETGTVQGAFHADGGVATLLRCYWEANNRNIVSADGLITLITPNELAGSAANSFTYPGIAFDLRGTTDITSYEIRTPRLRPDNRSGYDLTIGENLIAPLAGGSVKWGNTTTETIQGTATANTWTTVKAIPATEMTGQAQHLASYFYTIYAGYSDLTTGFDFGTIYNNTLRSFSGITPAWLRLDTQNVQVNIASSSYGLRYKIVLHRTLPGVLT
jgi:hypothetical protein